MSFVHDKAMLNSINSLPRILIVGNPLSFHVGAHFQRAAQSLGLAVSMMDMQQAYAAPRLVQRIYWRLSHHRPIQLNHFSRLVLEKCQQFRPQLLLATGLAPITAPVLQAIADMGILTACYATDDPWNPAHRTKWFFEALPCYTHIFSPRKANLGEFNQLGCTTSYLPFAYDPTMHRQIDPSLEERTYLASDVLFAGGGDQDRLPMMKRLAEEGFKLALYGGYWNKFKATRAYSRGHADLETICKAVAAAKVSLCLVRRANRDGHVMRSFEVPAIGGCMVTEDTLEHREIFGDEGEAVSYFSNADELVDKLRWLTTNEQECSRLARAAHMRITQGQHTYKDRLITVIYRIQQQKACYAV